MIGAGERWYEGGQLVRERCEGGSIEGGALSDQGAALVRGGAGGARGIAADVLGVPAPPKATGP